MRDRPTPLTTWHRPVWANRSNPLARGVIVHYRVGGRVPCHNPLRPGRKPLQVAAYVEDRVSPSATRVEATRRAPRIEVGDLQFTLAAAQQLARILDELDAIVATTSELPAPEPDRATDASAEESADQEAERELASADEHVDDAPAAPEPPAAALTVTFDNGGQQ